MKNTITKQKNQLKYQIRNHNYSCKNIVFSIGDFNKDRYVYLGEKLDLEDGEYEIYTSIFSTTDIDSLPIQKNVVNSRCENTPQFTEQHIRGKISVINGMLDKKELDNIFPKNWAQFNSHFILENISIIEDNWNNRKFLTMFLGS